MRRTPLKAQDSIKSASDYTASLDNTKPKLNRSELLSKHKANKFISQGQYGEIHKTPKGILKIDRAAESKVAGHIKDTKALHKLKMFPKIHSAEHFKDGGAIEREDVKNINPKDYPSASKVGRILGDAQLKGIHRGGRSGKRYIYTQLHDLLKQDPKNQKLKQLVHDVKRTVHHGVLPLDLEKQDNWGSRNGDIVARDLGIWKTFDESPKRTVKERYGNIKRQVDNLKRTKLEHLDYNELDKNQLHSIREKLYNLSKKHRSNSGQLMKTMDKATTIASNRHNKKPMPGETWLRNKYRKLKSNNNTKKAAKLLQKYPKLLKGLYDRPEPSVDLKSPYDLGSGVKLHKLIPDEEEQDAHYYDLVHDKKVIGNFEVNRKPKQQGIVKKSYIDNDNFRGQNLTPKIYATLAREHGGLESDDYSTSDAGYQIWRSLKNKGMADILRKDGRIDVNSEGNPRFKMPWHNIKDKVARLKLNRTKQV